MYFIIKDILYNILSIFNHVLLCEIIGSYEMHLTDWFLPESSP